VSNHICTIDDDDSCDEATSSVIDTREAIQMLSQTESISDYSNILNSHEHLLESGTFVYLNKPKAKNNSTRGKVVKRDDDLLTPEETEAHWPEILEAMAKELQTWVKLSCISRKPRNVASNTIDTRWVLKWKWDQPTVSVADSGKQQTKAVRVIRARLTIRGFKDKDKSYIDTYAGTSSKLAQKVIVSEAALRRWHIATTDISKAFLQGVTYKELAELTGEPLREVNFYLPEYNVPILKKLTGFESFDPRREVLHCDKPGTGSVDAPRAFSMKLKRILVHKCKMIPCNVDNELLVCREQGKPDGKLIGMVTIHVDDLKLAGATEWTNRTMTLLQEEFGELKITWNNFVNCGVCHDQNPETFDTTIDQIKYASTLKAIVHPQLSSGKLEDDSCPEAHSLYRSLLGAVAYLAHTRLDVVVFVSALQRNSHQSKLEHLKRLNKLLSWIQHHPKKILYKGGRKTGGCGIAEASHLRIISDAAFKKETDDGYSLRGVVYVRAIGTDPVSKNTICHILDWTCKSQRHVCRSTFAAELLGAGDAADQGLLVSQMMFEVACCSLVPVEVRKRMSSNGFVDVALYVDAKSVYAAVTATFLKTPAEKSLLSHVQFLRDMLDNRVIKHIVWIDTRDMYADGLTKGSVSRDALLELMDGNMILRHDSEQWTSKQNKETTQTLDLDDGDEAKPTHYSFLVDLAEAFAGRALITKLAHEYKLSAFEPAEKELGWDLSTAQGKASWQHMIVSEKPVVVVIGFCCTLWTSFTNLNWSHRQHELKCLRDIDRSMLRLMVWTMKAQHASGRYFLFENPPSSQLWSEPMLQEIYDLPNVMLGVGHACAYEKCNLEGNLYLWKTHRWMANHECLIEATCLKCPGTPSHAVHAKVEGVESNLVVLTHYSLSVAF